MNIHLKRNNKTKYKTLLDILEERNKNNNLNKTHLQKISEKENNFKHHLKSQSDINIKTSTNEKYTKIIYNLNFYAKKVSNTPKNSNSTASSKQSTIQDTNNAKKNGSSLFSNKIESYNNINNKNDNNFEKLKVNRLKRIRFNANDEENNNINNSNNNQYNNTEGRTKDKHRIKKINEFNDSHVMASAEHKVNRSLRDNKKIEEIKKNSIFKNYISHNIVKSHFYNSNNNKKYSKEKNNKKNENNSLSNNDNYKSDNKKNLKQIHKNFFASANNIFNKQYNRIYQNDDIPSQITPPDELYKIIKNSQIPFFEIDDFKFIKIIGEGSYGKIYLIHNLTNKTQFALKKIICHTIEEVSMFQKEFELIYKKVHSNIMKIYNIEYKCLDCTTYSIYVLMELAQYDWNTEIKIRNKKMLYYTENEIVCILKQLIKALFYLNKNNIAHRDIKPQNILKFKNNVYKLADFGEAKKLNDSIQEATLRGSQLFMAPILYNGLKFNKKEVIHNAYKSDIFSLGYCCLYAMCLSVNILNDIREIVNQKVLNLIIEKELNKRYSYKIITLLENMLKIKEDERYDYETIQNYLDKNY